MTTSEKVARLIQAIQSASVRGDQPCLSLLGEEAQRVIQEIKALETKEGSHNE